MTASLITKARAELTISEINARMGEIEALNSNRHARLEIYKGGSAAIFLSRRQPLTPTYEGQSVEDVLIMAYDDLMRSIADEMADGVGDQTHERAA